jgi:flagellar biosynthesis/type III secretory pathway protein FliH
MEQIESPCGCGKKTCRTCHLFDLTQRASTEAQKAHAQLEEATRAQQKEDMERFLDASRAILTAYKAGYAAGYEAGQAAK